MTANLHSDAARATAKIEGAQHLEELEKQGLLGIRRAVRAVVAPAGQSGEGWKTLHLIRHGQGFHNLLGDLYREFGREVNATGQQSAETNPYMRPEVRDPPLTSIGRQQAQSLAPSTKNLADLDLVVVSPLCRAIQTAQLAFPHLFSTEGGSASAGPSVPFVAHSDAAEATGRHVCDHRRPLTEIKADFPYVDWSNVTDEEDPLWDPEKREPGRSVSDRAHALLLWLRQRPEKNIAIATHSAWLFTLLNTAVDCDDVSTKSWFLTGEMRTVCVRFEDRADIDD